jgi:hypothetical protein
MGELDETMYVKYKAVSQTPHNKKWICFWIFYKNCISGPLLIHFLAYYAFKIIPMTYL